MIDRDSNLRDRENMTARKMRNAVWEQDNDSGPVWLWFVAGALILIAVVLA